MKHGDPPRSLTPLLVLTPLLAAVIVAALLTGPHRSGDETQAPVQPPAAPQSTQDALSPLQVCVRAVTQALTRLAMTLDSGGTADEAATQERQRLSPLEYSAYSSVIDDFMVARSRYDGVAGQVKTVIPAARKVCASS